MTEPEQTNLAADRLREYITVHGNGKANRDAMHGMLEEALVRARDNGCIAPRCIPLGEGLEWVNCDGPLDVDHVRASGGLGMKSPTHRTNMVVLCRHHHRAKTEFGKVWRPLLLAYLERVER